MRHLKYILILAFSFICYACVENDPDIETFPSDDVNFKYEVIGDYKIDYLVGSQIQFTNTSVVKAPVLGILVMALLFPMKKIQSINTKWREIIMYLSPLKMVGKG